MCERLLTAQRVSFAAVTGALARRTATRALQAAAREKDFIEAFSWFSATRSTALFQLKFLAAEASSGELSRGGIH